MHPAGVSVTVDNSMAAESAEDAPPTALIAIMTPPSLQLTIVDSIFTDLDLAQDTPLYLANSTVTIQNTSFVNNQATMTGALVAEDMHQLNISNSTFTSNSGRFQTGMLDSKSGNMPGSDAGSTPLQGC